MRWSIFSFLFAGLIVTQVVTAQPTLLVTEEALKTFAESKATPKLFDKAYQKAVARVERSMAEGIIVPTPKDAGGGYTHERHKENYKVMHDAGILYQIDGDAKYAKHVYQMLDAYADVYPTLPLHPERKNQNTKSDGIGAGKLFWQGLNEAVWLVYTIQGYAAIVDTLDEKAKNKIETRLLRPVADFLSLESQDTFRRIHNHATWSAAGVGMTGYAIGDQKLVDRAILGLDGDRKTGFLAQMEQLFSPDGYYTEGPYYQRYALMPFVVFAQAIDNNEPERKIFEFRDGILPKAIDATIQLSYRGKFFPINDAIREKGLNTIELVYGLSIAYGLTKSPELLSIAEIQGTTVLTGEGYALAQAVDEGKAEPFNFKTVLFRDGENGDQGALAVMRMGDTPDAQTLVVKNTSQGFGHGHFDKLSYQLYDGGNEIVTDYGAARFLNVPSKYGGRYLPENRTWAKQTVAHNTLVVNETSQFKADWREAQKYWPTIDYFSASDDVNVVSATMENAYPGVVFNRTLMQLRTEGTAAPVIVDIVNGHSETPAQFDLPLYFDGQLVELSGNLSMNTTQVSALGDKDGYKHLWVDGQGELGEETAKYTWLKSGRFYTNHMNAPKDASVALVRTGANDPNFNLRNQQGFIFRAPADMNEVTFVSVIEPHGIYDPAAEFTADSASQITSVLHEKHGEYDLVSIVFKHGQQTVIAISNNANKDTKHEVRFLGKKYQWSGYYQVFSATQR
jgi:hypothetical protein